MKLSEAKDLYINSRHEIAVHSLTHPGLEKLDTGEIVYEIMEDRKNIESTYGTIARGMAYPNGTYNRKVIDVIKACGICYARTIKPTESFNLPEDWLELHPTCHHRHPALLDMADEFLNKPTNANTCRLFYVWGHSFNFDNEDNWNVIEEFGKKVSRKNDVWYATNIEIYDYVQAYNSLVISADRKIITNLSAIDVWLNDRKETFVIKPGETLFR
ncbi:MAG: polysaccharide deacetylase family protein [Clostridia bacterium]|nr:polysaccharide deacetylase family protein [Clostridia bacterium]